MPEDKKVSHFDRARSDDGSATGVRPHVALPESSEIEAVHSTMPAEPEQLRTVSVEPGSPDAGDEDGVLPTVRPPAIDEDGDPYIGCVIDGRYCVESVLGEGGMGVVYACKHKLIGKRVAMKVLRADMARDPEVTTRFLNEARAASAIGNPHIIDISDFGRLPDGSTYFVMEYLDGLPLSKVIDPERPVPASRIIHIARQLAEGLAAAHHEDIVHRDLKPDNVYLVQHGAERDFVKILDFGIAKVSSGGGRLTRAGQVFGTPHYMSPEQSAGSAVDHRGDVYSLGVMMYEMASGHVPFDADNFLGILTQHMYKAPAPIRKTVPNAQDVPPGLEAIILKCLSKRQDQRYQSMDELIDDIDRFSMGEVPEAVHDLRQRPEEFSIPDDYFQMVAAAAVAGPSAAQRRHAWPLYIGLAAVLAAVGIGAAIFVQGSLADARRIPAPKVQQVPSATVPALSNETPQAPSPTAVASAIDPGDDMTIVHQVVLATEPIDAHVFLDGKDIGSSPVVVDVMEGQTARLEIRRNGYKSREVTVNGSEGRLSVRLERSAPAKPVRFGAPAKKKPAGAGPSDLGDPWAR